MTTPRFELLRKIDRSLLRQRSRADGLVQRGRVISVDDSFRPAVVSVAVALRGGQTATVSNVRVLSTEYGFDPDMDFPNPVAGQDILLLCPTGRVSDGAYVLGAWRASRGSC